MSETTNQDELISGEEYWISDVNKRPNEFNLGPGIYLGDDVHGDHYFKVEQIMTQKKYYTRVTPVTEKPKDEDIEVTDEMLADAATCERIACRNCKLSAICKPDKSCTEFLAKALQKEQAKKKDSLWDDVPECCTEAFVTFKGETFNWGTITPTKYIKRFERPSQKPIERQIADKHATCGLISTEEVVKRIESAINEYRDMRSTHD
jgi:hypothetical protein